MTVVAHVQGHAVQTNQFTLWCATEQETRRPPRLTSSTLVDMSHPSYISHIPCSTQIELNTNRILPIIFRTKYSSQVCNGMVDCPLSETGPGGEDEETCQEGIQIPQHCQASRNFPLKSPKSEYTFVQPLLHVAFMIIQILVQSVTGHHCMFL